MSSDDAVLLRFTRLLVQEAWLRDNDKFEQWLQFFSDNCRYWAPVRQFVDRDREDLAHQHRVAHIDENKAGLELRVKRLSSGMTYTEEPPPRTRRFISNVQVLSSDEKSATVVSYFMMFRSHPGHKDVTLVGHRQDQWVLTEQGWKINERLILIDQDRLPSYMVLL